MRKLFCFAMLLVALTCSALFASCSNEELDHVHEYRERILNTDNVSCDGPSCSKDARKEKICVICNDIVLLEVMPAKGHTPNDWQVKTEPTCTVNKVEEKLCKDCGEVLDTKVYAVVGHKPGDWQTVTNPTCTVNEVKGKLCKVCGEVVETYVEKLQGHIKSDEWQVITNGSCTENLVKGKKCTKCGEVIETLVEPVEGHSVGEDWQIVTNASCTENLVEGKACTKCGEIVETKVGEKLEHDYDEVTVLGTCSKGEHKLYTCKLCGYFFESEFLKPTEAHTEGGWIIEKAPTCSSEGVKMQICNSCGVALNRQNIAVDPNNHSFLVETFPPETEGGDGYVQYTCKSCGYEIKNIYESNYLPSQIYEMIASSTVRIEGLNKDGKMHNVGSGFFISANGELITNYHVIAGAYDLKVKLYGGDELKVVAVKGYNIENDIAILKVDIEGNSYLKLSTSEVKTGDPVYALGSPLGVDCIFTNGIVSNPLMNVSGIDMIVFTAPISTGSSGGPLVNARGEVVGINSRIAEKGQNLNFALPVDMIDNVEVGEGKTVYEVYKECLKSSGINALTYYVLLNYDKREGENRYIVETVAFEEVEGKYGRTVQLIYDNDTKELVISTNWIDNGKYLYSIEFVLDGVKNEYKVRFFDHGWSQYTVEGTVSTKTRPIDMGIGLASSVYDKIFSFDYVNYGDVSGSSLTRSLAKQLIGIAYVDMLGGFNTILEESNTELTLDVFNFQLPEKQEQKK